VSAEVVETRVVPLVELGDPGRRRLVTEIVDGHEHVDEVIDVGDAAHRW
jgi:hypothetical protein